MVIGVKWSGPQFRDFSLWMASLTQVNFYRSSLHNRAKQVVSWTFWPHFFPYLPFCHRLHHRCPPQSFRRKIFGRHSKHPQTLLIPAPHLAQALSSSKPSSLTSTPASWSKSAWSIFQHWPHASHRSSLSCDFPREKERERRSQQGACHRDMQKLQCTVIMESRLRAMHCSALQFSAIHLIWIDFVLGGYRQRKCSKMYTWPNFSSMSYSAQQPALHSSLSGSHSDLFEGWVSSKERRGVLGEISEQKVPRPRWSDHCPTIVHYWPDLGHTPCSEMTPLLNLIDEHWFNVHLFSPRLLVVTKWRK